MPAAPVLDVTDATFQTEVIERSATLPVVVDLWAPWCGPCVQLGPMIEAIVAETDGAVQLVKINIDENPGAGQTFKVQSIPAVYAVSEGKVVDGFIGAQPEWNIRQFVEKLVPATEPSPIDLAVASGDEATLRAALAEAPADERLVVALAEVLLAADRAPEALELLARIPESAETRRIAALARTGTIESDDVEQRLSALLPEVKSDEAARQTFVDILELMGPDDERTSVWRRRLTTSLY